MKSNIKREDVLRYIQGKFNQTTQGVPFVIGSETNPLFKDIAKESDNSTNDYDLEFNEDTYQLVKKNHIPVSVIVSEGDYASLADLTQERRITSASWSVAVSMLLFMDGQVHDKLLFAVEEVRDKFLSKIDFMRGVEIDYANTSQKPIKKYYKVVTTASDITPASILTVSGRRYMEYVFTVDLEVVDKLHLSNQFEFYISTGRLHVWKETNLAYWGEFGLVDGAYDIDQRPQVVPNPEGLPNPKDLSLGVAGRIKHTLTTPVQSWVEATQIVYDTSVNKLSMGDVGYTSFGLFLNDIISTYPPQHISSDAVIRGKNERLEGAYFYAKIEVTSDTFSYYKVEEALFEATKEWKETSTTGSVSSGYDLDQTPNLSPNKNLLPNPNFAALGSFARIKYLLNSYTYLDWITTSFNEYNSMGNKFDFAAPRELFLQNLKTGFPNQPLGYGVKRVSTELYDFVQTTQAEYDGDVFLWETQQTLEGPFNQTVSNYLELTKPTAINQKALVQNKTWNTTTLHKADLGYIKADISFLPPFTENGKKAVVNGFNLVETTEANWQSGLTYAWIEKQMDTAPSGNYNQFITNENQLVTPNLSRLGWTALFLDGWKETLTPHSADYGLIQSSLVSLGTPQVKNSKAIITGYDLSTSTSQEWETGVNRIWQETTPKTHDFECDGFVTCSLLEAPPNTTGTVLRKRQNTWNALGSFQDLQVRRWSTSSLSSWASDVDGIVYDNRPNTTFGSDLLPVASGVDVGRKAKVIYRNPSVAEAYSWQIGNPFVWGSPVSDPQGPYDTNTIKIPPTAVGQKARVPISFDPIQYAYYVSSISYDYDVEWDYFSSGLQGFPTASLLVVDSVVRARTFLKQWVQSDSNYFFSQILYKWEQGAQDPNKTYTTVDSSALNTRPTGLEQNIKIFSSETFKWSATQYYAIGNDPQILTTFSGEGDPFVTPTGLFGTPTSINQTAKIFRFGQVWEETNEAAYDNATIKGTAVSFPFGNPLDYAVGTVYKVTEGVACTLLNSTQPSSTPTQQDWTLGTVYTGADGYSKWVASQTPATFKWTQIGFIDGPYDTTNINNPPNASGLKARVFNPVTSAFDYYYSEVDTPESYYWTLIGGYFPSYYINKYSTGYVGVTYYEAVSDQIFYTYYTSYIDWANSNAEEITGNLPNANFYSEGFALKINNSYYVCSKYLASEEYYVCEMAGQLEAYYQVVEDQFLANQGFIKDNYFDLPLALTYKTAVIINRLYKIDQSTYSSTPVKADITASDDYDSVAHSFMVQQFNLFVNMTSDVAIRVDTGSSYVYWYMNGGSFTAYEFSSLVITYYETVESFTKPRITITGVLGDGFNYDENSVWSKLQQQAVFNDLNTFSLNGGMVKLIGPSLSTSYIEVKPVGGPANLQYYISNDRFYIIEEINVNDRFEITSVDFTEDQIMFALQGQYPTEFADLRPYFNNSLVIKVTDQTFTVKYYSLSQYMDMATQYYVSLINNIYYLSVKLGLGQRLTLTLLSVPNSFEVMEALKSQEALVYANLGSFYSGGGIVRIDVGGSYTYWFLEPAVTIYAKTVRYVFEETAYQYYQATETDIPFDNMAFERVLPLVYSWGVSNTLTGAQVLRNKALTEAQQKLSKMIHNIVVSKGFGIGFVFLLEETPVIMDLFSETLPKFTNNSINKNFFVKVKFLNEFRDENNIPYFDYDDRLGLDGTFVIGEIAINETSYGDNVIFSVGFAPSWTGVENDGG